ncbi:MAG: hypothetical protein FVQ84_08540 [Planctomycetes bacterium]|nr:hypothetical protein [Planctomycetota bacterium]
MDYEMVCVRKGGGYKNGAIVFLKEKGLVTFRIGDRNHPNLQIIVLHESELPAVVKNLPHRKRESFLKVHFRYLNRHFVVRSNEELVRRNPKPLGGGVTPQDLFNWENDK